MRRGGRPRDSYSTQKQSSSSPPTSQIWNCSGPFPKVHQPSGFCSAVAAAGCLSGGGSSCCALHSFTAIHSSQSQVGPSWAWAQPAWAGPTQSTAKRNAHLPHTSHPPLPLRSPHAATRRGLVMGPLVGRGDDYATTTPKGR
jgi:hypothetical protein